MKTHDLGSVLLRRWYFVVFAVIIALAGGFLLQRGEGLYTSETVVSFILPDQSRLSPDSGLDDSSVIAFAGVVAREVNGGAAPVTYSESDAPFYGAGIRQGALVSLPNAGNQWVESYQRAEIVLQIVGPSEQWVERTQSDFLTKIVQASDALQAAAQPAGTHIRASPVTLTKTIIHVFPSRSQVIAAFIALLIAALLFSGWAAVAVDRIARSRTTKAMRQLPLRAANEGQQK